MLEKYLAIMIYMGISVGIGILLLALGALIAPKKPSKEKLSQYECGFDPFEGARLKFDVRFYLVAILFIIFDLEVAFLFPWAVIVKELSWTPIIAMGIFLFLLLIGFIYEWKKGALEWE